MRRKLLRASVLVLLSTLPLFASDTISLKLTDQFALEQKRAYLCLPKDIAVDEEENIYVTDPKCHDIKMFDKRGRLVRVIGRKGGGPGEFESPWTVAYENGKLYVQDVGLKKYVILSRGRNDEFKEERRFFYLVDGHKFVVQDGIIISDDYFIDDKGRDFRGIILDLSGSVVAKLLPISFGKNDGWNRITSSRSHVGVSENGDIYFVKEREVKVFKFCGKGILLKEFGRTPPYFRPCRMTKDFEKAVFTSDVDRRSAWERWYSSFSWVSGIFVLNNSLGIVIKNFNNKLKSWGYHLQFYDHEGRFLKDGPQLIEIGTSSNQGIMMDSNSRDTIYFLETVEGEEPLYRFSKYRTVHR